jgi:cytochrome c-type biogenesis protein CcmH
LTEEFRCPKCLNTNLAGSDAPIAADLRSTVHRLILEGATDQAIRDFLQARYGDFVLYDPPLRRDTLLLWLAPALLLAVGLAMVVVMVRRRRGIAEPLSEVERAQLDELLRDSPKKTRNDADRVRIGRERVPDRGGRARSVAAAAPAHRGRCSRSSRYQRRVVQAACRRDRARSRSGVADSRRGRVAHAGTRGHAAR